MRACRALALVAWLTAGCAAPPRDAPAPSSARCAACEQIGPLGGTQPPAAVRVPPHRHVIRFNQPGCLDLRACGVRLEWREAGGSPGAVLRVGSVSYDAPGGLSVGLDAPPWSTLREDLTRLQASTPEPLRVWLSADARVPADAVTRCYQVLRGVLDAPTATSSWEVPPAGYEEALGADEGGAPTRVAPTIVVEEEAQASPADDP